jgi:hypothetical protein
MTKRFPRIASRTRPRSTSRPRVKLPPLRYGIYDADGTLASVSEVADPRNQICATFTELMASPGPSQGSYALPITIDDDIEATPRRRKAVKHG